MSFFKLRFIQNKCRICKMMHCCVQCRVDHENLEHDIFPDCDICIYGKVFLRDASEKLLNHIHLMHWPLHCIYCKRLFGSINELKEHIKCPVGAPQGSMEVAPMAYAPPTKTPIRPSICVQNEEGDDFYSPPIAAINKQFFHYSTPMVTRDDKILDKFPDTITPVDIDRSKQVKYANENLSNTPWPNDNNTAGSVIVYSKRRVTFSETPNMDNSHKNNEASSLKTSLKNCEPHSLNLIPDASINVSENFEKSNDKSDMNYQTTECVKSENVTEIQENNQNEVINKKKRISNTFNESLWHSAINEFDLSNDNLNESKIKSINKSSYCENIDSYETKPKIIESICYNDQACGSFECNAFADISNIHKKSLWSSMAHYVKSAVQVFQATAIKVEEDDYCHKRSFSEIDYTSDTELQQLKRRKITSIKCRPAIRDLTNLKLFKKTVFIKVDKSTQTD